MNTSNDTVANHKKQKHKKFNSGAAGRRDQEISGPPKSAIGGDERSTPKAFSKVGEFGTIGAKLTRPSR